MVAASVLGLFHIKYTVKNLKKDLLEINSQITDSKDEIHTLKAEWAYLSSPERIKRLSDRYLDLEFSSSSQVKFESDIKVAYFKGGTGYSRISVSPTLRPILSSSQRF